MSVRLEFLFDFGSPNAYLAHRVLPAIEARTGVAFEYRPVLLGGIYKATNSVSPAISLAGIKNKPEYERLEMSRFCTRHGIDDLKMNPHFPVNTLQLMRGAIAAEREGVLVRYVDEVFRHMWRNPKKMDDPDVIHAAFEESKLPGDRLIAGMQDPEIKQQLIENTEDAVKRGVFGIPSYFVGEELFFGKDRLGQVEAEISRSG